MLPPLDYRWTKEERKKRKKRKKERKKERKIERKKDNVELVAQVSARGRWGDESTPLLYLWLKDELDKGPVLMSQILSFTNLDSRAYGISLLPRMARSREVKYNLMNARIREVFT